MDECFQEDGCNYLFDILLDCSDQASRTHVGNLVRFLINKLKVIEKDRLYEIKVVEVEIDGEKVTYNQFVALSARFIDKALGLLTTQVSKNWSRFDSFLEIIYSFGVGSILDTPQFMPKQPQI